MKDTIKNKDLMDAACSQVTSIGDAMTAPEATFEVTCHDAAGLFKWSETIKNTVCLPGKEDLLNKYFAGSAYTAAWYMLLVGGSATIANTDTLASHAGWTEITAYSGNRPAISFGSASLVSTTANITATAVVFTMNATYTVAGAGCCTVATGTSGILYDAALFGSARSGSSGDTLTVTPTLSVA